MRCAMLLLVLSAGLVLAAQDAKEDAARKELDKLRGTWDRVSAEMDGKKVPAEEVKKTTLTIKGAEYVLHMGEQTRRGTLKLDPTTNPKSIDIISAEGPNKGKSLLGIYELAGDTFKYCAAAPGKDRPTDYSSKPGSGQGLYVNQRVKP